MFNYDGTAQLQRSGGVLQPFSSQGGEQDRRADDHSSMSGSGELKVSSEVGSVSKKQV